MKAFYYVAIFSAFFVFSIHAQASTEAIRLITNHSCSQIVNANSLERFSEKRMLDLKKCAKEQSIKKITHLCKDIYSGQLRLTKSSLRDCTEDLVNGKSILKCEYSAKTICLYSLR